MQEMKPIWDSHVNEQCGFNLKNSFKVGGVWVDDGHMQHSGSLTKVQADAQFQCFLDFCEKHGLEVSEPKSVWPTKVKEYTGFEIDSDKEEVRLTQKRIDKLLVDVRSQLDELAGRQTVLTGEGEYLLDLCGGIGTARHALLASGRKVKKHAR